MIAAIGGTMPTATDITMAAVTEKIRTTVHARMTAAMQPPIRMKYRRLRVIFVPPGSVGAQLQNYRGDNEDMGADQSAERDHAGRRHQAVMRCHRHAALTRCGRSQSRPATTSRPGRRPS